MKKILLFILLWNLVSVNAQNIRVEYIYRHGQFETSYHLLISSSDSISLWEVDPENYKPRYANGNAEVTKTQISDDNQIQEVHHAYIMPLSEEYKKFKHKKFVWKDFSKHQIIFTKLWSGERYYVLDSMDNFHWKITGKRKEIKGLQCEEAVTRFRGRTYSVYFTREIPQSDGPWKFHGLPGLILEVKSHDGEYYIRAQKISTYDKKIKKPKTKKLISWPEWVKLVRESQDKTIKYLRSKNMEYYDPDSGSRVKKEGMEVIHPVFSKEGVWIQKPRWLQRKTKEKKGN